MTERPILFSGPLVRAILDGRKTQTRRLVHKPKRAGEYSFGEAMKMASERGWPGAQKRGDCDGIEWRCACPYGVPGDRLWVRETWACTSYFNNQDQRDEWTIWYGADHSQRGGLVAPPTWREPLISSGRPYPEEIVNLPSIHMPRWVSRLTLEVTGVRVERLQDITEEDARAEGLPLNTVTPEEWTPDDGWLTPAGLHNAERDQDCDEDGMARFKGRRVAAWTTSGREAFEAWWDHINGARPGARWEDNPWVWVVDFRRVGGAA